MQELKKSHPKIKVILIVKDFRKAYEADFFNEIADALKNLMVNNQYAN